MAMGDGQVVFTVSLDDSAFQAGMASLTAGLASLGQAAYAVLAPGLEQLQQAQVAGALWAERMAAGIAANRSAQAAARNVTGSASTAAMATARSGGIRVGQNLVEGMASGAAGRSGALAAAVTGVVREALAAARRAAGIASPSRLFRDEVGQYLALGVQSGFEDTLRQRVMPAIRQGVLQSAAAGRDALDATLLSAVQRNLNTQLTLPSTAAVSAWALQGSAAQVAQGAAVPRTGESVQTVTQYITFESTMQAPDEVARAIRKQATYGLAGARG